VKYQWKQGFVPSGSTAAGIRMIRPVLILFITFAHFFIIDDMSRITSAAVLNFDNWFMVFLKAGLAKSGVPLLSLISGYLAVVSLERYGYGKLLWRKARRLIWPLFLSNILFIILITYPGQAQDPNVRPDLQIYPFNFMGWFQATFAYYKLPANEPLYFLKDLYTCFLLLPLLVVVARVKFLNVAIIVWMAYKCIYLKSAFLFEVFPLWFLRFDIVFAFYIGLLLHYWQKDLVIANRNLCWGLIALFLLVTGLASAAFVVLAKPDHRVFFLWADFTVKVCGVVGCLGILSLLAVRPGRVSGLLKRWSPYSYMLFLTHAFTFTFFTRAYLYFFPAPVFFSISGGVYLLAMLVAAVGVSIALRKTWTSLVVRARGLA